jgi:transcription elongation factor GreA
LADCDTDEEVAYQLVGEYEADVTSGLLSVSAPLARALIGKSVGDIAEVVTPGGHKDYEIIKISYQ